MLKSTSIIFMIFVHKGFPIKHLLCFEVAWHFEKQL